MSTAQLTPLLRYIRKLASGHRSPQRPDWQLLDDFSAHRDEAAFAALVARHGPMVLRVCRRVLNHEQDAEDAFQATFLVLARSTGSIRKREALSGWLHGVAYRTAMEAKRKAARRRNHEARLWSSLSKAAVSPSWDDVQAVLDEEIQRLPEVFRSAFVLCVLEGKSGPEAAAELGVRQGTVSSRLARARQRLQQRLTRRGIKLAALMAALSVAESAGQASMTAVLADTTIRSGLLVAAGGTAAGVIPSHIAALAAGVTRAMFLTKAKIATAVLLAVGVVTSAGVVSHQALAGKLLASQATPAKAPQKTLRVAGAQRNEAPDLDSKPVLRRLSPGHPSNELTYGGRVLGPDGQPVAGAKLYLTMGGIHWQPPGEHPMTGPDGHFQFTVPKAEFEGYWTVVTAAAPMHGPGWVVVPAGDKRDNLTLQLVNDDVPITGQIVDLEGKPVPDATLRVRRIDAAEREDLGPWLEAAKGKKGPDFQLIKKYLTRETIALSPTVSTDARGRFRLTGIGRNRLVEAQLEGPTIVTQVLHILTRPGETIEVLEDKGNPEYGEPRTFTTYYGASFRHVAAPTKPIVGVVRDKDTKKPLAGVTVRGHSRAITASRLDLRGLDMMRTTSDAQGRYRLVGMPKGEGYKIVAIPRDDQPYLVTSADVPDTPGLGPVTVDLEFKRGVWIEGKITDKVTGKAVKASVEYYSMYSNPNLQRDYPGFIGTIPFNFVATKEDGSYRVVGLPGPGLVAVHCPIGNFLQAPEREDEYGVKESSLNTAPYAIVIPSNFCALARIDPVKGVESVKRDVTIDPGWTFTGTVLGLDGKPLIGARGFGTIEGRGRERKKTSEFTVRAFNPHRPRDIYFQHLEKGLVGVAQPPKENGGSVTVQMAPGAAVKGRLVDANGKPRPDVELELRFHSKQERSDFPWSGYSPEPIKTDSEGRFRIEALLPGYEFRLSDDKGELTFAELRSGETKDLGDVRVKERKE